MQFRDRDSSYRFPAWHQSIYPLKMQYAQLKFGWTSVELGNLLSLVSFLLMLLVRATSPIPFLSLV